MRKISILPLVLVIVFNVTGCLKNYDPIILGHPVTGTFVDNRDGKIYKWTRIGQQTWMAENLAYLPFVTPVNAGSEKDNCYYIYNFSGSDLGEAIVNANYILYGVLYNAPAAVTACPAGWHVPQFEEWETLAREVLGYQLLFKSNKWNQAGRFLKADITLPDGNSLWNNYSLLSTPDTFRFSALPGGYRDKTGVCKLLGENAFWWEEITKEKVNISYWYLNKGDALFRNEQDRFSPVNILANGYSIRCIKNVGH